ncbi:MAG: hypothetical protein IJW82_08450 [Clostridia bacterium]|nr:hypothetical protein [Clostridia bacterium]
MKETIKTKILIIGMLLILLSSFSMDIDKNKIRADFEIYKITFDSQDSTLVGYESVFCYNETSDVYAIKENDTLFEKCTYPYSTEQKQGYVVTFLGWYDIYGEEIIRYNQDGFEDGSKLKLLTSTTYTTLTGNWHLSCDITLYPKFSYDALPSKINFVTSSSQVIISGTNYAYIDYDSEHLCKDSLCLEYLEKSGFPVAQKYQLGYTYEFLGWFSSMEDSAKQVFDSNNTLIKNVEGFTDENGKWKHLGNVALYPQFEENPIVVKITLTIEENVVIDGVDTIYVAYMQNILYSDKELKEPIQNVTTAQKQGIGYEYIFDGWKNINGKCVINKNGELNTFVGGYTDE